MVLPLGPIWGRLDEAAHLRLSLDGPAIRRAESLLGFTHKGTLALMRGKSPRAAARFAARLSGDATVAHSVAFAQATESAVDVEAPTRAAVLRIVMMEVERIAVHLDNLAEVGRLADVQAVRTRCGGLREELAARVGRGVRPSADDGLRRARRRGQRHRRGRFLRSSCARWAPSPPSWSPSAGFMMVPALVVAAVRPGPGGREAGDRTGRRRCGRPSIGTRLRCADGVLAGLCARWCRGSPSAPRATPRPRQHLRIFEIEESLRLVSAALDALPDGPVTRRPAAGQRRGNRLCRINPRRCVALAAARSRADRRRVPA